MTVSLPKKMFITAISISQASYFALNEERIKKIYFWILKFNTCQASLVNLFICREQTVLPLSHGASCHFFVQFLIVFLCRREISKEKQKKIAKLSCPKSQPDRYQGQAGRSGGQVLFKKKKILFANMQQVTESSSRFSFHTQLLGVDPHSVKCK